MRAFELFENRVIIRGLTIFIVTFQAYAFFAFGHFYFELKKDSTYILPRSLSYRKLPKEERHYYKDYEHQVHEEKDFQMFAKVYEMI